MEWILGINLFIISRSTKFTEKRQGNSLILCEILSFFLSFTEGHVRQDFREFTISIC